MGTTCSKEETIVSQAGNSGGVTAAAAQTTSQGASLSMVEVMEIALVAINAVAVMVWCVRKVKKTWERRLRREIAASQPMLQVAASQPSLV